MPTFDRYRSREDVVGENSPGPRGRFPGQYGRIPGEEFPQPSGWRSGMDPNVSRPPGRSYGLGPGAYGSPGGGATPEEMAAYQQAQQLEQQMLAQGASPEQAGRAASGSYQGATLPSAPSRNTNYGGPAQYKPDYTTEDPRRMATQDRTVIADRGNRLDQSLMDEQQYRGAQEDRYRGAADTAYGDLAETPGYTTQEQQEIRGDPSSYGQYFNPEEYRGIDAEAANWQRGVYDRAGNRMDSAIEGQERGLGRAGEVYARDAGINTIGGEANIRGAIDYSKLGMSRDFVDNYRMSDADAQDIVNAAGTNVANRYGAAIGDLQRDAAASGAATPLAIGAGRARLERQSAADAADAMTEARIRANEAQAGREATIEQTRLGAEQAYAGMRAPAEERMMQSRLNVGANILNHDQNTANELAGNRLTAEQYRGNLASGVEGNIGQQRANTSRYITDTGGGINQTTDQTRSTRGTQIADAGREGRAEYRGYLTGQTGQQMAAGQAATENRIKNYGVQAGGQNQATGQVQDYDIKRRGQSFGTNFKSNLGASMGKGIGAYATS